MVGGKQMDSNNSDRQRLGSQHLTPEIYFLVAKFLSNGPCQRALQAIREEIEEHKVSLATVRVHVSNRLCSSCQNVLTG